MLVTILRTLAVLGVLAVAMAGCGGDVRKGFPRYAPGVDASTQERLIAMRSIEITGRGVVCPVATRGLYRGNLVVDVLVALPARPGRAHPAEAYMKDIHNRLAFFNAAEGKGMKIALCGGQSLRLSKLDLEPPVSDRERQGMGLARA